MAEGAAADTAEKMRPKFSKAWENFDLNAAKKVVICKICKMELAWHGSTTMMNEHMKRKHVGIIIEEGETSVRVR